MIHNYTTGVLQSEGRGREKGKGERGEGERGEGRGGGERGGEGERRGEGERGEEEEAACADWSCVQTHTIKGRL